MRRARKDGNHAELTGYLGQCGWRVVDTSAVGPNAVPGFPDALAVGYGEVVAVEFKVGKAPLTIDEQRFRDGWPGEYQVLRCLDDVLNMTRKYACGVG
jgi:Holliday junction resolvase